MADRVRDAAERMGHPVDQAFLPGAALVGVASRLTHPFRDRIHHSSLLYTDEWTLWASGEEKGNSRADSAAATLCTGPAVCDNPRRSSPEIPEPARRPMATPRVEVVF